MKKLAIFFTAVAVLSLTSLGGWSEDVNGLRWSFYVNDELAGIESVSPIEGTTIAGAVQIPSVLGGYPVVGLRTGLFDSDRCNGITSVTIPYGVRTIPELCFRDCKKLVSVNIPDSVTGIGLSAFLGCSCLQNIVIGNGVTSIGSYAFSGCSGLKSVTIPPSVSFISTWAFRGCESLEAVHISSLSSWCQISFGSTSYVTSNRLEANPLYYARHLYLNDEEATDIVVPDGVEGISDYAFINCHSLTSVVIPNGVKTIGANVFSGCGNLRSLTLPNANKHLGFLFGMEEYEGASPVRQYYNGYKTYYLPTNLVSVTVTDATDVKEGVFEGCWMLKDVHINEGVTSIDSRAFRGSGITNLVSVLPSTTTYIGVSAFASCSGLECIPVPDGVETICGNAFENCANATSFTIPDSVTTIGEKAFAGCRGLSSVVIPNSVKTIKGKGGVFSGCGNLRSLTLPNANTLLGFLFGMEEYEGSSPVKQYNNGYTAYYLPTNLVSVTVTDATDIKEGAFEGCWMLKDVHINEGVTSVNRWAFRGSGITNLVSVLPSTTTYIGVSAFASCSGLECIPVPDGVETICGNAFENCANATSFTIPDSVTTIGEKAFAGCRGLSSVVIPNSVKTIGANVFSGCGNLRSLTLPNANTLLGILFGTKEYEGSSPVKQYNNGYTAYYLPTNLVSVTVTDATDIKEGAFEGCWMLKDVHINEGVTSIGYEAFENCTGLSSYAIPSTVQRIGSDAFAGCSGLVSIVMMGDVIPDANVGNNAFARVPPSMVIYVQPEATGWGETWQGFQVMGVGPFTVSTPTPVPHLWFDTDYPSLLAVHGGDYEAAANAMAANGVNKVWECYVAGLDPTNADAKFTACIKIGVDGVPIVTWEPRLSPEEEARRTYVVEGKASLSDAWSPTNTPASRFFRVKVSMP